MIGREGAMKSAGICQALAQPVASTSEHGGIGKRPTHGRREIFRWRSGWEHAAYMFFVLWAGVQSTGGGDGAVQSVEDGGAFWNIRHDGPRGRARRCQARGGSCEAIFDTDEGLIGGVCVCSDGSEAGVWHRDRPLGIHEVGIVQGTGSEGEADMAR